MSTSGVQINERQARELAKVDPERRTEVLERAQSGGEISARSIREAAATEPSPPDQATREVRDRVGRIIPDIFPDAQCAFLEADTCQAARSSVRRLATEINALRDHPAMAFVSWGDVEAAIGTLRRAFQAAGIDPWTISPLGGGGDDELSRGAGWLPKTLYERAIPEEIRMRHENLDS